jgi:CBS-domain-containing membrane protein
MGPAELDRMQGYALTPSGERGEIMSELKARDIMTAEVQTASVETPLAEIARLLAERYISGVPVVDAGGAVVGIVCESDLIRALAEGKEQ